MSDDPDDEDDEDITLREVLECEDCGATFSPEAFGCASCDEVPEDMRCPHCAGIFSIAGIWSDEEGEKAK